MKTKIILLLHAIALTIVGYSQDFEWSSEINNPTQTAFYKIDLSPQVISKLNSAYSDIRIFDNADKEVPYVLKTEVPKQLKTIFKAYEIVDIKKSKNYTAVIIRNDAKTKINNIQLSIKNFDVTKHLELSGSNDKENWYAIKENYKFRSSYSNKETFKVNILNFPYSDYEYYRIVIFDVFTLPINILEAGYYDTYSELGKYNILSSPSFVQIDSASIKKSLLKVHFDATPYLNSIHFEIDTPSFYHRKASFGYYETNKKGKKYFNVIRNVVLRSDAKNEFNLTHFVHKDFYLIIDNEDNPPLSIVNINAKQLNSYLIAYLDKDRAYKLSFGKAKTQSPQYDLSHFMDSIPDGIKTLKNKAIIKVVQQNNQDEKNVDIPAYWLWLGIALVVLLLGFMTNKMLKEMKSK
jgi:hypothetical protein